MKARRIIMALAVVAASAVGGIGLTASSASALPIGCNTWRALMVIDNEYLDSAYRSNNWLMIVDAYSVLDSDRADMAAAGC